MKKAVVLVALVFAFAACKKTETSSTDTAAGSTASVAMPTVPPTQTSTAATSTDAAPTPIAVSDASVPAQGLAIWLRADTGVTAGPDGSVSEWKSPNNMAARQGETKLQPKLVQASIGGKPAMRFDGENSMLETNLDINPQTTPNLTVISVFDSRTDAKTPLRKLYGADNGGYDRAVGLDNRAETNYTTFAGSADVISYFNLEKDKPYLTVDEWTAATFNGWVNGKQAHPVAQVTNEEGLPHMFIGGTGTSYHEPWMGDIAEMLVYTRTLTDQERTQIEDYLAKKYSITLERGAAAPTTATTATTTTQ